MSTIPHHIFVLLLLTYINQITLARFPHLVPTTKASHLVLNIHFNYISHNMHTYLSQHSFGLRVFNQLKLHLIQDGWPNNNFVYKTLL